MKKRVILFFGTLSIVLSGCSTATLDSYGISVEAARTSTLMVSAGVIAGLVYLELNSRNGWQASVKQIDDTHYDVRFGRSILSFESAQPINASAKDVVETVCPDGGRWKRLEEGVNAQQIGVKYYAKGLLQCNGNNEKLVESMKPVDKKTLPALDGSAGVVYKNIEGATSLKTVPVNVIKPFELPPLTVFKEESYVPTESEPTIKELIP